MSTKPIKIVLLLALAGCGAAELSHSESAQALLPIGEGPPIVECEPAGPCETATRVNRICRIRPRPNGSACTLDACHAPGTCQAGECVSTPLDCDDHNSCTDDSCEPWSGCSHVPHARACDDGNACTVASQCINGACTGLGPVSGTPGAAAPLAIGASAPAPGDVIVRTSATAPPCR
jgi:hypothetical protein